jgi:hypothetical protein
MIRYRWRTELKKAATEEEVLELVRQYLQTWSFDELASLPQGTRPPEIGSGRDVAVHAFKLGEAHARFDAHPGTLPLLQELLLFFTHASVRVTQLRHAGSAVSPASHNPARATLSAADRNLFEAPEQGRSQPVRRPVTGGEA